MASVASPEMTSEIPISRTLTPSRVAKAIRHMRRTKKKKVLFVWGPPGIAKSQVAQQVATGLGIAFIDVRLSQIDSADLRGMPYPVTIGNVEGLAHAPPMVLPRDLDERRVLKLEATPEIVRFYNPKSVTNHIHYCTKPKITVESLTPGLTAHLVSQDLDRFAVVLKDQLGNPTEGKVVYTVTGEVHAILGFEEFNSAKADVMAASYSLILDRNLGEYVVPDGVYMMAMGNREDDKGITFKMPLPLVSRFNHIEMEADVKEWVSWALKQPDFDPKVIGYINAVKNRLFVFDKESASRGYPTPRSWEAVSDITMAPPEAFEEEEEEDEDGFVTSTPLPGGGEDDELVLSALIRGAVGEVAGNEFISYRTRYFKEMPNVDDILSGKVTKLAKTIDISLAYMLCTSLCYELKKLVDPIRAKYTDRKEFRKTAEYADWLVKADRMLGFFLSSMPPEMAVMGYRAALHGYDLPFDTARMANFGIFTKKFRNILLTKGD